MKVSIEITFFKTDSFCNNFYSFTLNLSKIYLKFSVQQKIDISDFN